MTTRQKQGKFVEPNQVTTIGDWIDKHNRGYLNCIYDINRGVPTIVDQKTMNNVTPTVLKEFKMEKGVDSIRYITYPPNAQEYKRAEASLIKSRDLFTKTHERETVSLLERSNELKTSINSFRLAPTYNSASAVSSANQKIALNEKKIRNTLYASGINEVNGLKRSVFEPQSRDDRMLLTPLYRLTKIKSLAHTRSIPIAVTT